MINIDVEKAQPITRGLAQFGRDIAKTKLWKC